MSSGSVGALPMDPSDTLAGAVEIQLEQLRAQLLDVSDRQRLLDFPHSSVSGPHVRLIHEPLERVFNRVMSGHALGFRAVSTPEVEAGVERPKAVAAAEAQGLDPSFELPERSDAAPDAEAELQTLLFADEMALELERLHAAGEAARQELGAGVLHLAVGFLEWKGSEGSGSHLAPLALVPIRLDRKHTDGAWQYRAQATTNEPEANIALGRRLLQDFELKLPRLTEATALSAYLSEVREATESRPGWQVHRFATVGVFALARFVLLEDLSSELWQGAHARAQNVLLQLLGDKPPAGDSWSSKLDLGSPGAGSGGPPLILEADSVQREAIEEALRGRNLVLRGAPGTGKTQTIVNLVAAALHAGKRVLVVANKVAALHDAERRLAEAGLSPFCLGLFDPYRRKVEVLRELSERLDLRPEPGSDDREPQDPSALEAHRALLSEYSAALQAEVAELGQTVYQFLWHAPTAAERVRDLPSPLLAVDLPEDAEWTVETVAGARQVLGDLVARVAEAGLDVSDIAQHPWTLLERPGLSDDELADVKAAVRSWHAAVEELATVVFQGGGDPGACSPEDAGSWSDLASSLPPAADIEPALLPKLGDAATAAAVAAILDAREREAALLEKVAAVCQAPELVEQSRADLEAAVAAIEAAGAQDVALGDLSSWVATTREQAESWTTTAEQLRDALRACNLPPNLSWSALKWLARVIVLLRKVDRRALSVRAQVMQDEAGSARLVSLAQQLQELNAAWAEAEAAYPGMAALGAPELRRHASVLRSTSPFARVLSGPYREAEAVFLTMTGGRKTSALQMAEELVYVATLLEAREKFEADPNVAAAAGSLFAGLATDFEPLLLAQQWVTEVCTELASFDAAAKTYRDFLLTASVDTLTAFDRSLEPVRQSLTEWLKTHPSGDFTRVCADLVSLADKVGQSLAAIAPLKLDQRLRAQDLNWFAKRAVDLEALKKEISKASGQLGLKSIDPVSPERLRATIAAAEEVRATPLPERVRSKALSGGLLDYRSLWDWLKQLKEATKQESEAANASAELGIATGDVLEQNATLQSLSNRLARCVSAEGGLAAWMLVAGARQRALASPAACLVQAIETEKAAYPELLGLFEHALCRLIAKRLAAQYPFLAEDSAARLETAVQRLDAADRDRIAHNRRLVTRKLAEAELPASVDSGPEQLWTNATLIRHEAAKEQRQLPLRALVQRAREAVLRLKPCLLMSPTSAARMLPSGATWFDLVIFDEASLMRPEEAAGAILRGRQLVVVGDEQQLSPTGLLENLETRRPEDERPAALQSSATVSVFDLALTAFESQKSLEWHYRSKHERLIAFSNKRFYGERLRVFPSALRDGSRFGVCRQMVEGVQINGKNRGEASAVAQEAASFVREQPDRSLGIIATTQDQAELIRSLLDATVEHPGEDPEPLFVKPVDQVQGDKRDVVFVSTTFGSVSPGASVAERFDSIPRDGGDRLVNILATRAREQVVVFASVEPGDVSTRWEGHPGLLALRDYLEYAAAEGSDGSLAEQSGNAHRDDPFEQQVARLLEPHGFSVVPQVGTQGVPVGLCVKHRDCGDRYLCAIGCDMPQGSSPEAERSRRRQLESRGWKLLRVWSVDWYQNPDEAGQRLLEQVRRFVYVSRGRWGIGR